MIITGKVQRSLVEERTMTNKEGVKQLSKVSHVVLITDGDDGEIVNIRAYDAPWSLPDKGTKWTSPRVRRYECFDGMVADVTV